MEKKAEKVYREDASLGLNNFPISQAINPKINVF